MRIRIGFGALAAGLAAAAILAPAAVAQLRPNTPNPNHPGRAVYQQACAACHENATGRTASFSQLTGTSAAQLRATLSEGGVMAPMAASLSGEQMAQLIGYLTSGQQAAAGDWTAALMCGPDDRTVDVTRPVAFGGFGVDPKSTRNLSARQAGLTKADMGRLEIAWAVGFPQTQSLGTGAVVVGDTVYLNAAGRLLALDAAKGCARWTKAVASRNTPQVADLDGRKVLIFSVGRGEILVVDAKTGDDVWKADGRPSNGVGAIRGGVVVYRDKIIVPISASGVGAGQNAKFECCVGHGAVVALSLKDGKRLWEYHTMKEAEYTGAVSKAGVKQRGPSGAPIWALPTIDAARNRVIVATGENTSHPGTDTSDALISLDLDTGKPAWVFQAMKADVWNMSCNDRELQKSGPNCPNLYDSSAGRDFDFGATPMIVKGAGGRDIVVNGQKSGHVWAVDAATGKVLWTDRIGEGSALGGVHWGVASDGKLAFIPVADSLSTPEEMGTIAKPGVYAYRLTDGKQVWAQRGQADCAPARKATVVACDTKYGFSAAPLVVDGAVVTGTLDGKVVVFDAATGKVLKTLDTASPLKTVNGVPGKGGSIDAHAISAGAGMIFVTSGYGSFTQTPGNVLVALKPR
jgi:polyvinyl alcohol dehydrogenase (cytochrome)